MTSLRSENIAAALSYANRNWSVLTLHSLFDGGCTCDDPKCTSVAKHPVASLFPHGLKDATTDPEEIKFDFTRSHANIGVATGSKSGIAVLDVDGKEGERSLGELEKEFGPLPKTVKSLTGRGCHIYFNPD